MNEAIGETFQYEAILWYLRPNYSPKLEAGKCPIAPVGDLI